MSNDNSLAGLAKRIRAEHKAAIATVKRGLAHAVTAGELLLKAKSKVEHGGWLPWLAKHVAMSERTAQAYMRAAKYRKLIDDKSAAAADLRLDAALSLIAKPAAPALRLEVKTVSRAAQHLPLNIVSPTWAPRELTSSEVSGALRGGAASEVVDALVLLGHLAHRCDADAVRDLLLAADKTKLAQVRESICFVNKINKVLDDRVLEATNDNTGAPLH